MEIIQPPFCLQEICNLLKKIYFNICIIKWILVHPHSAKAFRQFTLRYQWILCYMLIHTAAACVHFISLSFSLSCFMQGDTASQAAEVGGYSWSACVPEVTCPFSICSPVLPGCGGCSVALLLSPQASKIHEEDMVFHVVIKSKQLGPLTVNTNPEPLETAFQ